MQPSSIPLPASGAKPHRDAHAIGVKALSFTSISLHHRPSFSALPKSRAWRRTLVVTKTPASEKNSLPQLQGFFCGRPATFLVDSGASGNFVNLAFARKYQLQTRELAQKQQVQLADGSHRASRTVVGNAKVKLGSHSEHSDFVTMPLNGHQFDVILGVPWLRRANPKIDWTARTVTFDGTQPKCKRADVALFESMVRTGDCNRCMTSEKTHANRTVREVLEMQC